MVDWFFKQFQSKRVSSLEHFIISHHPKDIVDVERLMREYDRIQQRRQLWN
jgi:hypothetical protein